jgi:hypothetical protein
MTETCQTSVCYGQLLYIMRKLDILKRLRLAEAVYLAVQWADEAVEIYDNQQQIQVELAVNLVSNMIADCSRHFWHVTLAN